MYRFLDRYFNLETFKGSIRMAIAYAIFSTASIWGFIWFGNISGWTANYPVLKLGMCSAVFPLFTLYAICLAIKYKIKGEPPLPYRLRY